MGKCQKFYDDEKEITSLVLSGIVQMEEIIQWLQEFYEEYGSRNLLWDFIDANVDHITDEDVAEILNVAKQYSHLRPGGKTALVIQKTKGVLLARYYDYFGSIDGLNLIVDIFDTRQQGLDWLSE